jgi:hypothetical protein
MELASSLAKDVLIALFRYFPGQFVLVGGGALHWIFNSPRLSADFDLKPTRPLPDGFISKMAETLSKKLAPTAARLGVALSCEPDPQAHGIRIRADGRPVLHIELALLAPVTGKEKHLLQSDSLQSEIIVTPDIHQLLFAKAAALVKRPALKGRDVFDIWFLQSRGATLDADAFTDWLKWEEMDSDDLRQTLQKITPARLHADLSRFLPEPLERQLAEDHYKTLVEAAHALLKPFV